MKRKSRIALCCSFGLWILIFSHYGRDVRAEPEVECSDIPGRKVMYISDTDNPCIYYTCHGGITSPAMPCAPGTAVFPGHSGYDVNPCTKSPTCDKYPGNEIQDSEEDGADYEFKQQSYSSMKVYAREASIYEERPNGGEYVGLEEDSRYPGPDPERGSRPYDHEDNFDRRPGERSRNAGIGSEDHRDHSPDARSGSSEPGSYSYEGPDHGSSSHGYDGPERERNGGSYEYGESGQGAGSGSDNYVSKPEEYEPKPRSYEPGPSEYDQRPEARAARIPHTEHNKISYSRSPGAPPHSRHNSEGYHGPDSEMFHPRSQRISEQSEFGGVEEYRPNHVAEHPLPDNEIDGGNDIPFRVLEESNGYDRAPGYEPEPRRGHGPYGDSGPRPDRGPDRESGSDYDQGPDFGPGPGRAQESHREPGPGPYRGPGSDRGPGPYSGPGPERGPGPDRGPGPYSGPGPERGPGPDRGPEPYNGPGPERGPGPDRGPGPYSGPGPDIGSGPGRDSGPGLGREIGPGPGPGPSRGPGPEFGPGPGNGPHNEGPEYGPGPGNGRSPRKLGIGLGGIGNLESGPNPSDLGPSRSPRRLLPGPGPRSNSGHGPGFGSSDNGPDARDIGSFGTESRSPKRHINHSPNSDFGALENSFESRKPRQNNANPFHFGPGSGPGSNQFGPGPREQGPSSGPIGGFGGGVAVGIGRGELNQGPPPPLPRPPPFPNSFPNTGRPQTFPNNFPGPRRGLPLPNNFPGPRGAPPNNFPGPGGAPPNNFPGPRGAPPLPNNFPGPRGQPFQTTGSVSPFQNLFQGQGNQFSNSFTNIPSPFSRGRQGGRIDNDPQPNIAGNIYGLGPAPGGMGGLEELPFGLLPLVGGGPAGLGGQGGGGGGGGARSRSAPASEGVAREATVQQANTTAQESNSTSSPGSTTMPPEAIVVSEGIDNRIGTTQESVTASPLTVPTTMSSTQPVTMKSVSMSDDKLLKSFVLVYTNTHLLKGHKFCNNCTIRYCMQMCVQYGAYCRGVDYNRTSATCHIHNKESECGRMIREKKMVHLRRTYCDKEHGKPYYPVVKNYRRNSNYGEKKKTENKLVTKSDQKSSTRTTIKADIDLEQARDIKYTKSPPMKKLKDSNHLKQALQSALSAGLLNGEPKGKSANISRQPGINSIGKPDRAKPYSQLGNGGYHTGNEVFTAAPEMMTEEHTTTPATLKAVRSSNDEVLKVIRGCIKTKRETYAGCMRKIITMSLS